MIPKGETLEQSEPDPMAIIPFDDRDGLIWQDGRMVAWREAKVHVLTHGLHYASCVFERSEEHTSELQSLMRISYAVFCLKKKTKTQDTIQANEKRHEITE